MKKNLIIVGTILSLLAIVAGGLFFINRSQQKLQSTLIKEEGTILIKPNGSTEYIEMVTSETKFESGLFIKTGEESYARIFLPDNSLVSLDENTETQINFATNNVDIQQLIGKTWNRVQTVTNGGEYKVQTPNTIAAVRGTIFGVGVDNDDNSRVFVEDSKVQVNKYEDDDKVLESVDLILGDLAKIIRDDASFRIEKGQLEQEFKDSFWYKRNKILDEEWSKIKNSSGIDLIKALNDALLKRDDYETYKLAKPSDNSNLTDIEKELEDVYSLSDITENTCVEKSQTEIQAGIDTVKKYADKINDASDIVNLLTRLKGVCEDGQMTPSEAQSLQSLITKANE